LYFLIDTSYTAWEAKINAKAPTLFLPIPDSGVDVWEVTDQKRCRCETKLRTGTRRLDDGFADIGFFFCPGDNNDGGRSDRDETEGNARIWVLLLVEPSPRPDQTMTMTMTADRPPSTANFHSHSNPPTLAPRAKTTTQR
jgi:hypothetical protein